MLPKPKPTREVPSMQILVPGRHFPACRSWHAMASASKLSGASVGGVFHRTLYCAPTMAWHATLVPDRRYDQRGCKLLPSRLPDLQLGSIARISVP